MVLYSRPLLKEKFSFHLICKTQIQIICSKNKSIHSLRQNKLNCRESDPDLHRLINRIEFCFLYRFAPCNIVNFEFNAEVLSQKHQPIFFIEHNLVLDSSVPEINLG